MKRKKKKPKRDEESKVEAKKNRKQAKRRDNTNIIAAPGSTVRCLLLICGEDSLTILIYQSSEFATVCVHFFSNAVRFDSSAKHKRTTEQKAGDWVKRLEQPGRTCSNISVSKLTV